MFSLREKKIVSALSLLSLLSVAPSTLKVSSWSLEYHNFV